MTASKLNIAPSRSAPLFAVATVAMIVVSYLIVMLLAAACVYLPYLLMTSVASQNIQILALFVGGLVIAGAMLWSLVPKRIKFEVPGLLLDGAAQPRLFSEINAIAAALNEPMPGEVYLIGDVNAFVAERGGFMGFRTRRVLAIGLPLFAAMSISEMRGVLAHEFAHYYGGDTRLGPFVYRVKDTIFRTFRNIEAVGVIGKVAIIRLLYTVVLHLLSWYFRVFLRAINFVSRKQEFRADELACYVAGGNSMAQGLRKLRAGSLAWHFYWFGELAPVVAENALPPIGEGFATLLDHSEITEAIRQAAESQIENGETSPYDTHPPMRERLAAIEGLQIQAKETNHEPALSLLADGANVEMRLLAVLNSRIDVRKLSHVQWAEVGETVTIPSWKRISRDYAPVLRGRNVEKLPTLLLPIFEFSKKRPDPAGTLPSAEQRMDNARDVMGIALGLTLVEHGWTLKHSPGTFRLERGADRLNPLEMAHKLGKRDMTQEIWQTRCEELGIASLEVWVQNEEEAQTA